MLLSELIDRANKTIARIGDCPVLCEDGESTREPLASGVELNTEAAIPKHLEPYDVELMGPPEDLQVVL